MMVILLRTFRRTGDHRHAGDRWSQKAASIRAGLAAPRRHHHRCGSGAVLHVDLGAEDGRVIGGGRAQFDNPALHSC